MSYEHRDWSSLSWYPSTSQYSDLQPGAQVAIPKDTLAPGSLPHLIFLPQASSPDKPTPLLVFLHGQGESSPSPLASVALQGPPQTAGVYPTEMPFAVLSPQKPLRSEFFQTQIAHGILQLIEHYVARHNLDPSRVYLTGLSQGGIGCWNLAAQQE